MSIAEKKPNTSLVTIRADLNALATIEGIVGECGLDVLRDENQLVRTMKLAAGIGALRKLITNEMMQDVMMLQGTSLGFRTDKDSSGGYPVNVVKDCMIETVLKGGNMVGNEMNIISARAYFTKEFYTRKLREYPGLTDLVLSPSVPVLRDTKAYVSYSATWKLNGRPDRMDRVVRKVDSVDVDSRIPVKVNAGMGDDAILGKAERKMRKAIYDYLTGSETSDGDISDVVDRPALQSRPASLEALTDRLTGASHAATPSTTATFSTEDRTLYLKEIFGEASSFDAVQATIDKLKGPEATEDWSEFSDLIEQYAQAARERIAGAQAASSTSETVWPPLEELIGKLAGRNSEASVVSLREAWISNHPQQAETIRVECDNRIAQIREAKAKQQELIQ